MLAAFLERPSLCEMDLARAWPRPDQPLHGRLKHLTRLLHNPRLDELAPTACWLKLSYHFRVDAPTLADGRPLLPVAVDTTYFEPFACLLAGVPCGSRGLPIALTTYHRTWLKQFRKLPRARLLAPMCARGTPRIPPGHASNVQLRLN